MGHSAQFNALPPELVREYAREGAQELTRRGTRYKFTASDAHRGGVVRQLLRKMAQQQQERKD